MPKVKLEFDLPHEDLDFKAAKDGQLYALAILDLSVHFRKKMNEAEYINKDFCEARVYNECLMMIEEVLKNRNIEYLMNKD